MNRRIAYRFAAALSLVCLAAASCSRYDDAIDRPVVTSGVSFRVADASAWSGGDTSADGAGDGRRLAAILPLDADGEQTYLHVFEQSLEAEDSAPSTRVSPITGIENFHSSFGVSATCYPSATADDKLSPNLMHNEYVSVSGDVWKPKNEVQWPGSGTIRFHAYAPHATDKAAASAISISEMRQPGAPIISYTVPADVKKQIDLMTATADCAGSGKTPATLTFGHVLTAVTISAGDKMLTGKVTKVTFSGVYGTGTHSIGSDKWDASGVRSFTFDLSAVLADDDNAYVDSGATIADGELTLMMIPQTLPKGAKLSIAFTDDLTGVARVLTADLSGMSWPMGKKIVYAVSSSGIVFEPKAVLSRTAAEVHLNGLLPTDLAAYVNVVQKGYDPVALSAPFTVDCSTDGGTTWSKAEWLADKAPDADASADTPVSGRLRTAAQPAYAAARKPFIDNGLMTEAGKGTAEAPYDLSRGGETANCYIVDDHGYYSIPLFYGNARGADGGVNTSAYLFDGVPDDETTRTLTSFVGHDNLPISSPEIQGAADAVLVWQDAPDLVTDIKLDGDRIVFRVDRETLTQGNAVIAVRNAEGAILWSWHIWATYYRWDGTADLPTHSKGADGGKDYLFSPCNLGYCDPRKGDSARSIKLRFTFTLPDGTKKTVAIDKAFPQPEIIESMAGDNTYYQWGRKDPMLPGIYNPQVVAEAGEDTHYNMINKPYYKGAYEFCPGVSGVTLGDGIRNPYMFFMHGHTGSDMYGETQFLRRHWHDGTNAPYAIRTIINYWNAQLCHTGQSSGQQLTLEALEKASALSHADPVNDADVAKSIYDPCPAGYHVPTPNAFSQLAKYAGVDMIERANDLEYVRGEGGRIIGWKLSLVDGGGEPKIFFPSTGLRDMGYDGAPDDLKDTSWPAHADLTFVATSVYTKSGNSCMLFYIDCRPVDPTSARPNGTIAVNVGTNNSYGLSVRPVRD